MTSERQSIEALWLVCLMNAFPEEDDPIGFKRWSKRFKIDRHTTGSNREKGRECVTWEDLICTGSQEVNKSGTETERDRERPEGIGLSPVFFGPWRGHLCTAIELRIIAEYQCSVWPCPGRRKMQSRDNPHFKMIRTLKQAVAFLELFD